MSTRRPRYRYIAFRIDGTRAFTHEEVLDAFREAAGRPWLVEVRGTMGLARTTHLARDAAIETLKAIRTIAGEPVTITTVGTSGTIRKATEKYLRRRRSLDERF